MTRLARTLLLVALAVLLMAPPAWATFPYPSRDRHHLNEGEYQPEQNPNDVRMGGEVTVYPDKPPSQSKGDREYWEYSSKDACQLYVTDYVARKPGLPPHPNADNCSPATKANPKELMGITGMSLDKAWETTTGEPEVIIAIHDSGIEWDDISAMRNLNNKTWLNSGELPTPAWGAGGDDANGDGVFNIQDYCTDWARPGSCEDSRVGDLNGNGIVDPEDLIFEFSDGVDDDGNGYKDDFVGWDAFEDDNDPYDELHYGHGTGEAEDSTAEVNNGVGMAGVCPNCMAMHMRVGDSFIADTNNFAEAALYATDNGASVIQSALGTLNNSRFAQEAIDYAYRRGVAFIASAADESAGHHNQPSVLEHAITMNSSGEPQSVANEPPPQPPTYLEFRGCTNWGAYVTATVPSNSCSSEAVGRSAGVTGLMYSAAQVASDPARDDALLPTDQKCVLSDYSSLGGGSNQVTPGRVLSAEEVRQLYTTTADDYDFTGYRDRSLPGTRRYPASTGWDPFFGYGRINARRVVEAIDDCKIPPEADITSPRWFDIEDTSGPIAVEGRVASLRSPKYSYTVEWAPWSWTQVERAPVYRTTGVTPAATGDRSSPLVGRLATIDPKVVAAAMVEAGSPAPTGPAVNPATGRGDNEIAHLPDKFGVILRVTVTAKDAAGIPIRTRYHGPPGGGDPNADVAAPGVPLVGIATKEFYLHNDPALFDGFPIDLVGDGAATPRFADIDDDGRDEMLVATSNGRIHSYEYRDSDCEGRPTPCETPGWPVESSDYDLNYGAPAYRSGEISTPVHAAILRTPAVGDIDRDGDLEVVAGDFQGRLFAWDKRGQVLPGFPVEPNFVYSTPQRPEREAGFYDSHPELVPGHYPGNGPLPNDPDLVPDLVNRHDKMNRMIWWWMAAPSLGNIDSDKHLEIVAGNADRHLYAFNSDGSTVPGWPVILRDPAKLKPSSGEDDARDFIDPVTHELHEDDEEDRYNGAKIINSVALGDIDNRDGDLEIAAVVNEQYNEPPNTDDPQLSNLCQQGARLENPDDPDMGLDLAGALECGNQRIYALDRRGSHTEGGEHPDEDAYLAGWPARIASATLELLPVVGNGPDGAPIIANVNTDEKLEIGIFATAGPGYILNNAGESIYGNGAPSPAYPEGRDRTLLLDAYGPGNNSPDHPTFPAVGGAIFSTVGPGLVTFAAPSAGLGKLLDIVLPEDQQVSDNHLSLWQTSHGGDGTPGPRNQAPAFPREVNDLQFLATPASADINGDGRQELLEGSAYSDLHAFDGTTGEEPGLRALAPDGWPKFTGGWTVAPPSVGDFDNDGKRDVAHVIREGRLFLWRGNGAGACAPATWPEFAHDPWNTNNITTDALRPRVIRDLRGTSSSGEVGLTWTAPGDDGVCRRASHYEIRRSSQRLTNENFEQGTLVATMDASAPGSSESKAVACGDYFVAIRTFDAATNRETPAHPVNLSAVSNNVRVSQDCVVEQVEDDQDPTETPTPTPSGSSVTPSPSGSTTPPPETGTLTVTISSDHRKVGYKKRFTLSGTVTENGECSNVEVTVSKRVFAGTRARTIGTVSVDEDGSWSMPRRSGRSARYKAMAHADSCVPGSSREVPVRVRVGIFFEEQPSCAYGDIDGRVAPRHKGTHVKLQRKKGGRWKPVDRDRLNRASKFELHTKRCRGRHRVVWPKQARDNIRGVKRVPRLTAVTP